MIHTFLFDGKSYLPDAMVVFRPKALHRIDAVVMAHTGSAKTVTSRRN